MEDRHHHGAPSFTTSESVRREPARGRTETWRRLLTWDGAPELQMGLDGALLELGDATPVLRFYTWRPDTLSLGYFQRWADVPGTDRAGAVVRRVTGGGAIHHRSELTFSISAPADHALYRGPVADSYARVHAAIAEALAEFGVEAQLRDALPDSVRATQSGPASDPGRTGPTGRPPLASDLAGTGMCFHASTPLDLCWDGRKGVGSAQRRTGGRVLHHGSIKLDTTELDREVATVCAAPAELAEQLERCFARAFACRFEPDAPRPDELELAAVLGARASSAEFLHRR